jgi:hypothetical protein
MNRRFRRNLRFPLLLLVDPSPKGVKSVARLRGRDPLDLPNLLRGGKRCPPLALDEGHLLLGGLPIQEKDDSLDDFVNLPPLDAPIVEGLSPH